jgi:hypothetical protein
VKVTPKQSETGQRPYAARLILAAFVLLTEIIFLYFLAAAGVEFVLSSLLVTTALLLQIRFGIQAESATPADVVVFIFNWLFLDFAPKIQLISAPSRLVNTSTASLHGILITNLMCALFIVAFTASHALLSRRLRSASVNQTGSDAEPPALTAFGVFLMVMGCVAAVLVVGPYVYSTAASMSYGTGSNSSPMVLVGGKFFLFLPSATFLILLNETVSSRRMWTFTRTCALMLLALLVGLTENPSHEGRSALGPIYLSIILIAFASKLKTQNRRMGLLVGGMVLVFPISALFTHQVALSYEAVVQTIEYHYLELHYDAWANIYTTVEIVRRNGIEWGHQLAGSLLFFVPSSLWSGKAAATGIVIGKYLMANYRMWFTNLSAPLVAEAYIDFGALGVLLYGTALPFLIAALNNLALRDSKWSSRPIAMYFAVFLLFALRGSLMVAGAYGIGAFLAFTSASFVLSLGNPHLRRTYAPRAWSRSQLPERFTGYSRAESRRHDGT